MHAAKGFMARRTSSGTEGRTRCKQRGGGGGGGGRSSYGSQLLQESGRQRRWNVTVWATGATDRSMPEHQGTTGGSVGMFIPRRGWTEGRDEQPGGLGGGGGGAERRGQACLEK